MISFFKNGNHMLLLAACAMIGSCCKDSDVINLGDTPGKTDLSAITDRLCSAKFVNASNLAKKKVFRDYTFTDDGKMYIAFHTDRNHDLAVDCDTAYCEWSLSDQKKTKSGVRYYDLAYTVKLADNGISKQYVDTLAKQGKPTELKDTLYLTVDGGNRVTLYDDADTFIDNVKVRTRGTTTSDQTSQVELTSYSNGADDSIANIEKRLQSVLSDAASYMGPQTYGDWMKNIDGNIPVYALSIPGTHDTFTFNTGASSPWARTQILNLEEQWAVGVRCFDFRLAYHPIIHPFSVMLTHGGYVFLDETVQTAFQRLETLLKQHSDETAIVVVQYDTFWTPSSDAYTFLDSFVKSKIDDGTVIEWHPGLTMQQARGHIIIIGRYTTTLQGVAKASGWGNNSTNQYLTSGTETANLWVQDAYSQNSGESGDDYLTRKVNMMSQNLDHLNQDSYSPIWTLDHTSGYVSTWGGFITMSYPRCANTTNKWVEQWLTDNPTRKTGVIVMDFAGIDASLAGGLSSTHYNTNCKTLPQTIVRHNNTISWGGNSVCTTPIE